MAKEYINKETGTFEDASIVDQEVNQYKRLIAQGVTDDEELSHRLAVPKSTVRKMRKYIGE